jgi:hypothetical protein
MAGSVRAQIGYNTAKRRALEALAREPVKWWTVAEWSRAAAITPKRRMYTYALRLARYDLVKGALMGGQLVYHLSPEGAKRLAWLRAEDRAIGPVDWLRTVLN